MNQAGSGSASSEQTADMPSTGFGKLLRDVGEELAQARRSAASPTSGPTNGWRKLTVPSVPVEGQSLRGLVAHACRANDIPNAFGVLRHLGLAHRNRINVSECSEIDSEELAYAIGVDKEAVEQRRYQPTENGRRLFFGLEVRAKGIESSIRRFSPKALRAKPHHRALWELRDLPFCFEGWDMLQDRCGCEPDGVVQRWSRTGTWVDECDSCGDPLTDLLSYAVPAHMISALGILEPLVHPDPGRRAATAARLPARLQATDRSRLFSTLITVAGAIDSYAVEAPAEQPELRLNGLFRACSALMRWPAGLSDVQLPTTVASSSSERVRAAWAALGCSHSIRTDCASERDARATLTGEVRKRNGTEATGPAPTLSRSAKPVGLRPATETSGLSPQVLMDAWNFGLVTRHLRQHGPRTLAAFDVAEVEALGERWRRRCPTDAAARQLGMPSYGVEQLAAMNVLPIDEISTLDGRPCFAPDAPDALERTLHSRSRERLNRPVSVRAAIANVGGRPKPWGPIFCAMLTEDKSALPFQLLPADRLVDRLVIEEPSTSQMKNFVSIAVRILSSTFPIVSSRTMRSRC